MPSTIQSMIQAHCSHSTSVKAHVCLHISLPAHLVLSRKVDFSKEFKRSIHSRKIYEGKGASPPSLPQSLHHHTFSAKEPFSSKQGKATWLHWWPKIIATLTNQPWQWIFPSMNKFNQFPQQSSCLKIQSMYAHVRVFLCARVESLPSLVVQNKPMGSSHLKSQQNPCLINVGLSYQNVHIQ